MTIEQVTEWRSAQPPKIEAGPIYKFRKGYGVNKAGKHETSDQYSCFQKFLMIQGNRTYKALEQLTGVTCATLSKWADTYNWHKRAAAYDRDQMAIVWKQAQKIQQNAHRDAVIEFRETSERQAKMMARVSEDLLRILSDRISKAEECGEEIPMNLVSGLLRASATVNEQSRQSWAASLGINEMLQMIDNEVGKVDVEDVTEVSAYEIPLDE